MANVEADSGRPLAAIILFLVVAVGLAGGIALIGPAALGLFGILGTFLMFVALITVCSS